MTVHVIGAGMAGLSAALLLARAGRPVVLHEAAPEAGGRARALPDGTDNGTHALVGANHAALRFLDAIGARARWIEPEPGGLPVLDLADGRARRVALSPAGWRDPARRPDGASPGGVLALLRLALPGRDRPVAEAFRGHPALLRGYVEPLTVAALNTPAAEASSRRLAAVLRRTAVPGAARLLVAERGLGPDLVQPALDAIRSAGGEVRTGHRLRELAVQEGRAAVLRFDRPLHLSGADAVLLATPPWESARLLPGLPVPGAHAPILNLHFAHPVPGPVRFLGVLGGLCQWVLTRPAGIAVTVSAADAEAQEATDALAPRAWAEIRAAARAFSLPGDWPEAPPPGRAIRERRATPRHTPGPPPRAPARPLANAWLAGDWTDPVLPATIDAAIRSGTAAARRVLAAG
ncbi:FAD-dependent oxidoreductase [Roseomonas sp. OT10]|uniref:hydroxysqualene dehydroxylase n=1 Tax=Roseomonas cutis TaxID=2897332 RepID=UPI001E506BC0|nr:FAD-dependent oxidoreductase [Roseomonas sp. OT10]UFN49933.1 FAD-dependent oxidoreductase [Roseomonas sp. OT10]